MTLLKAQDILGESGNGFSTNLQSRSISVLANQKIKDLYWHSFGPTYSLKMGLC